jgi:hypothetical protein
MAAASVGWLLAFCAVCLISTYVSFTLDPEKSWQCSQPLYLQLDLFCLFVPTLGLIMVPSPFGMPCEKPWYVAVCILIPVITMLIIVSTSFLWGGVIAKWGVWMYDKHCMLRMVGDLPIEDYIWFLSHACLAQMLVVRMWARHVDEALPPRPRSVKRRCADWKISVGMLALCVCTAAGVLLMQSRPMLYLGTLLTTLSPVIALQWVLFGHFYMWQPSYVWIPIVMESGYAIVLDLFATSRGIWSLWGESGIVIPINLFGSNDIHLEQLLAHCLTSTAFVFAIQPMLLVTKAYYQHDAGSPRVPCSFRRFLWRFICTDGNLQDYEPMSCFNRLKQCLGFRYNVRNSLPLTQETLKKAAQLEIEGRINQEGTPQLEARGGPSEPLSSDHVGLNRYNNAIEFFERVQQCAKDPSRRDVLHERMSDATSNARMSDVNSDVASNFSGHTGHASSSLEPFK